MGTTATHLPTPHQQSSKYSGLSLINILLLCVQNSCIENQAQHRYDGDGDLKVYACSRCEFVPRRYNMYDVVSYCRDCTTSCLWDSAEPSCGVAWYCCTQLAVLHHAIPIAS